MEILKITRKAKKIKLTELSQITRIPRIRLGQIESEKSDPRLSDLRSICEALGLKVFVGTEM